MAAGPGDDALRPLPAFIPPVIARHMPGLVLAGVVSLAATLAAQVQGGSPLLYALVLGLLLNWAAEDGRAQPGLAWAAGPLLRLAVGLLGARLAAQQWVALGAVPLAGLAGAMVTTVGLGLLMARLLRLPWTLGLLAGGANAICGASATLAIASVLTSVQLKDDRLPGHAVLVAACATTISTLAVLLYPPLTHLMGLDAVQAGLFLGGSIQDVAQVVAAGYTVGPQAGDTAIALKLTRVALLGPIVALIALVVSKLPQASGTARRSGPWLPGFVWLFFALMVINSMGWMPQPVQLRLGQASQAFVTVSVAALGMRLSLRQLARMGWRPFVLMGLLAAWIAGAMAFVAVHPG